MTKKTISDTLDLKKLKLLAKDLEDLHILAAHLQDALIPLITMSYDPQKKVFRALANRFCWEHNHHAEEEDPTFFRTHTGLEIHHVNKVLHKNFDFKDPHQAYNLLTLQSQEDHKAVHLVFSEQGEIRLEVDELHFKMGDIEHPWPTKKRPKHIHDHLEELKIRHTLPSG